MLDLVNENFLLIFFASLAFVLFFIFLVRRSCISLFDPLILTAVGAGFSCGTLVAISKTVNESQFWSIVYIISYCLFFIAIYLANTFFFRKFGISKMYLEKEKININFFSFFTKKKLNRLYFLTCFLIFISILLNTYFSYLMITNNLIGDGRLVLRQDHRFLDLIKRDLMNVGLFLAGGLMALSLTKNYILGLLIFFLGLAVIYSGSKSILLHILFVISFGYCILGKKQVRVQTFLCICAFGLLSFYFLKFLWGYEIDKNLFFSLIFRLFASGDVYPDVLISSHLDDYFGLYNWMSYLGHPFIRIFGYQGYDYPLGVAIAGNLTGDYSGIGPNPALPVLISIFSYGNSILVLFLMFFAGIVVWGLRYFALNVFYFFKKNNPLIFVCFLWVFFALPCLMIFDISVALQQFIGNFFLILLFFSLRMMYKSVILGFKK